MILMSIVLAQVDDDTNVYCLPQVDYDTNVSHLPSIIRFGALAFILRSDVFGGYTISVFAQNIHDVHPSFFWSSSGSVT